MGMGYFSRCCPFSMRHFLRMGLVHLSIGEKLAQTASVTRLGDLLHYGQLFKASGNNYFAQIAHIFRQFL